MKCEFCGSDKITTRRIPEHIRTWEDGNGESFCEYMPEATDFDCTDCGRFWTIYDDQSI